MENTIWQRLPGLYRLFGFCDTFLTYVFRYLGVTPPIATSGPSKAEEAATEDLMKELRAQGTFESEEESRRRCVLRVVFNQVSAANVDFAVNKFLGRSTNLYSRLSDVSHWALACRSKQPRRLAARYSRLGPIG